MILRATPLAPKAISRWKNLSRLGSLLLNFLDGKVFASPSGEWAVTISSPDAIDSADVPHSMILQTLFVIVSSAIAPSVQSVVLFSSLSPY